MKLKLIGAVIFYTALLACEPPVTFTEPQPVDTANLSKFPERLHGRYVSLSDSSWLTIDAKVIQRIYDLDYRLHVSELDSVMQLEGDTLLNLETMERTPITREGDSLVIHIHYTDTLFEIDNNHLVRKFKGYYFLNTIYGEGKWEVKKVQLSKGALTISHIAVPAELQNLQELEEHRIDTLAPAVFKATKKQFKKFVKNGGFTDSETFIRQVKKRQRRVTGKSD